MCNFFHGWLYGIITNLNATAEEVPVKSKNHDKTHSLQGTHKLMANTCISITHTAFLVHKMNHRRMQRYIHEHTQT